MAPDFLSSLPEEIIEILCIYTQGSSRLENDLAGLCRVSKQFHRIGTQYLYEKAFVTWDSAAFFARTLEARPELARRVRELGVEASPCDLDEFARYEDEVHTCTDRGTGLTYLLNSSSNHVYHWEPRWLNVSVVRVLLKAKDVESIHVNLVPNTTGPLERHKPFPNDPLFLGKLQRMTFAGDWGEYRMDELLFTSLFAQGLVDISCANMTGYGASPTPSRHDRGAGLRARFSPLSLLDHDGVYSHWSRLRDLRVQTRCNLTQVQNLKLLYSMCEYLRGLKTLHVTHPYCSRARQRHEAPLLTPLLYATEGMEHLEEVYVSSRFWSRLPMGRNGDRLMASFPASLRRLAILCAGDGLQATLNEVLNRVRAGRHPAMTHLVLVDPRRQTLASSFLRGLGSQFADSGVRLETIYENGNGAFNWVECRMETTGVM